ncbi:phosphatidylinositol-specific phospholipase C domain-containing protein [Xenorhabdus griffiniae]|uniref:phosphatidylinositol-specific phospholipase C domain-containing protein n=1 Tax=Xenorhabdus griffiniae TaxID=351672 RepID=UPI00187E552F|nr:phosphatidylinositol-specific phospholipase C domain-containing protein [Xenorhabdus griffiniae]MBE8587140.1 phosphatidylinositol-specific phospholipase C domain-containing protein [Xenorhabdus griffiniae]
MRYSLLSNTNNWMSCIDDSKSLACISIPGTHISCARKGASGQPSIVDRNIATQNSDCTITKQLEDGIRYLDIRCCAINDVFTIHYDKFYLNINFGDVLNECISFLEYNSSETIIMRIKQEGSSTPDSEFLKIFNTHYSFYHSSMYLESAIPTLGEVRGKIVILSNVLTLPGIPYSSIKVQDVNVHYDEPRKKSKIIDFVNESTKSNRNNDKPEIYLNHCGAPEDPTSVITGYPESFAKPLLLNLVHEFKEGLGCDLVDNSKNEAPHIGIIVMDFYTDAMVAEIVKRNENRNLYNLPIYSIFNEYYGRHYFYASLYMDSVEERRQVFDWAPGNKVINGFWMLIPYDEKNAQYYIFNTYYKEFLYASVFIEDNRRTVFTRINGVPTRESVWTIKNGNIYNEYYKCYLYESSLSYTENRKLVPCWALGGNVAQDEWQMTFENKAVN